MGKTHVYKVIVLLLFELLLFSFFADQGQSKENEGELQLSSAFTGFDFNHELLDETWIAYIGVDNNVWLIHPDGEGDMQITDDSKENPYNTERQIEYLGLEWSPDGNKLAFIRQHLETRFKDIFIYNLTNNQTSMVLSYGQTDGGFDWYIDSDHLIYDTPAISIEEEQYGASCPIGFEDQEGLYILDLTTGESVPFWDLDISTPIINPKVSPNGESVIFEFILEHAWYPNQYLVNISNPLIYMEFNLEGFQSECDWSPDGSMIVCGSWLMMSGYDRPEQIPLSIFSKKGELIFKIPSRSGFYDNKPIWSPSGNEIVFNVSGHALLLGDGPCCCWLREHPFYGHAVEMISMVTHERKFISDGIVNGWSPDSQKVVISSYKCVSTGKNTCEPHYYIHIVDVNTLEKTLLVNGKEAAWQPVDLRITSLIQRHTAAAERLAQATCDLAGGTVAITNDAFQVDNLKGLLLQIEGGKILTEAELAAFERFVIQEETVADLLAYQAQATCTLADSLVDYFGLAWSTIELFTQAAPVDIKGPVIDIMKEVIEWRLQYSQDEIVREGLKEGSDLIASSLTADDDPNALSLAILKYVVGSELREYFTGKFLDRHVQSVAPTLEQGSMSVTQESSPYWYVEGSVEGATMQMDHLRNIAQIAQESSSSMIADIQRGSELNDVIMEIGDLATALTGGKMTYVAAISAATRVFSVYLTIWKSAIAEKAYACILNLSQSTGEKAFQPSSMLVTCPELTDLDSIPPWLEMIFNLPFWNELRGKIKILNTDLVSFENSLAGGQPTEIQATYQQLRSTQAELTSLLDAAQAALQPPPGEYSVLASEALFVETLSVEMNLALIDGIAAGALAGEDVGDIHALLAERADLIQASGKILEEVAVSATGSTELPEVALPVLGNLPASYEGMAGQPIILNIPVINYGTHASGNLLIKVGIEDEWLDSFETSWLQPDGQHSVQLTIGPLEPGVYWLDLILEYDGIEHRKMVSLAVSEVSMPAPEPETVSTPTTSNILPILIKGGGIILLGLVLVLGGLFGLYFRARK